MDLEIMRWGMERRLSKSGSGEFARQASFGFRSLLGRAREFVREKEMGTTEDLASGLAIEMKVAYGLIESLAVERIITTAGNTWQIKK